MTTTAATDRTLKQRRMANLQRANVVRKRRAELKEKIADGSSEIAVVILQSPPDWAAGMQVAALLLAIPRIGPVKLKALLRRCDVKLSTTLQELTSRQRTALIAALPVPDHEGARS